MDEEPVRFKLMAPKHADARPGDPDAWYELGVNDPPPEWLTQNMAKGFAPMVVDFLGRFHLRVSDFDHETFTRFWHAFLRSIPERVSPRAEIGEKTKQLFEIIVEVVKKKLKQLEEEEQQPQQKKPKRSHNTRSRKGNDAEGATRLERD